MEGINLARKIGLRTLIADFCNFCKSTSSLSASSRAFFSALPSAMITLATFFPSFTLSLKSVHGKLIPRIKHSHSALLSLRLCFSVRAKSALWLLTLKLSSISTTAFGPIVPGPLAKLPPLKLSRRRRVALVAALAVRLTSACAAASASAPSSAVAKGPRIEPVVEVWRRRVLPPVRERKERDASDAARRKGASLRTTPCSSSAASPPLAYASGPLSSLPPSPGIERACAWGESVQSIGMGCMLPLRWDAARAGVLVEPLAFEESPTASGSADLPSRWTEPA